MLITELGCRKIKHIFWRPIHPSFYNYFLLTILHFLYTINHTANKEHIRSMLNAVKLDPTSKKRVKHFSLGMKQRLAIAQAIMENPEILILDEPMNGLDKQGIAEMRQLFLKQKEMDKIILLASHNREDIDILCDEVYEMEHGKLMRLR